MSDLGDVLSIDKDTLLADRDRITRGVLGAGADAVRATTKRLERNLEDVARSTIGGKLWRAFASEAFPRKGPAREPVGTVFLKGGPRVRGAMAFFTQPGRIVGKRGQFLAIPTPAAGSRGRLRDLTPGQWERQTGQKLDFIYRVGKPSLLVARGTTNQRSGAFRPLTRQRTAADIRRGFVRGEQSIIVFVLIPSVPFANRFAIGPILHRTEGELALAFFDRVREFTRG